MEYVCDKNTISASSFSITANRVLFPWNCQSAFPPILPFPLFPPQHVVALQQRLGPVLRRLTVGFRGEFNQSGDGALSFTSETAPILLQRMTLGHAQVVTSYGAVEIEDVEITAGKLLYVTTLTGPISVKRLRLKNAAAELAVGEGEVEVDFHDATFEGTMTLFSTCAIDDAM